MTMQMLSPLPEPAFRSVADCWDRYVAYAEKGFKLDGPQIKSCFDYVTSPDFVFFNRPLNADQPIKASEDLIKAQEDTLLNMLKVYLVAHGSIDEAIALFSAEAFPKVALYLNECKFGPQGPLNEDTLIAENISYFQKDRNYNIALHAALSDAEERGIAPPSHESATLELMLVRGTLYGTVHGEPAKDLSNPSR